MSDAKVRGTVHLIEDTKTYGQKGFRKRLLVLEQDNERFTNYIPVEFLRDDCDTADGLKVGSEVEVTYRLSGRKWQRDANSEVKFFLSAEVISFEVLSANTGDSSADAASSQPEPPSYNDDDVPF